MGNYGNLGKDQGNMKPDVENYQRPEAVFSQKEFNKTTEYISRHNAQESKAAGKIEKQAYKGRYS